MVTNDATILRIKHEILYEVAKLAWNDQLEDGRDDIPYKISPGPQAQYRCCVYKEREIVRQRIRLAEGKCPSDRNTNNVVQVINAACEECPIASYTVTDNCRKCMGKACQNSCPFGAISMGNTKAHIDPDKCRECGKCSQACPYNAIAHLERPCKKVCPVDAITYDEYGVCVIDEKKCIQCGACIHSCPFGAIGSKTFMVDVIRLINAGKKVVAMLAPATEGQFGPDITFASWKTALKKIGFADMIEVGLGGDMTAAAEAEEWAEAYKEGKKMTTSCCPAWSMMAKKLFPEQANCISMALTPMTLTARLVKHHQPGAKVAFIGPCAAKKLEAMRSDVRSEVDFVLTFEEMAGIFAARHIDVENLKEDPHGINDASSDGRNFAVSGGVAKAVVNVINEKHPDREIKVANAEGLRDCRKLLMAAKAGKYNGYLLEGMACPGGCVAGAGTMQSIKKSAAVVGMYAKQAEHQTATGTHHVAELDKLVD